MTECQHEFEPQDHSLLVVDGPLDLLRHDHRPSIVPCRKCGAPINRGRSTGMIVDREWLRAHGFHEEDA